MNTPVIQTIASRIAEELTKATGEQWTRSAHLEDQDWRAEITGPASKRLFISNTWAGKGRLYISGSFPDGTSNFQPTERPSITVAEGKEAVKIARDVKSRLLPTYEAQLLIVLKRAAEAAQFEASRVNLAQEVAKVVDGRLSNNDAQMVYSGNWDFQVTGPDSIRVHGHGNYLTLEQLRKIAAVCPELFRLKSAE